MSTESAEEDADPENIVDWVHLVPRHTVLIVGDHELFNTSLRMALRGHGIDAHQVALYSRAAVLRRARGLLPGLAVLDLGLDLGLGSGADVGALRGSEVVATLRGAGWEVLIVSREPNKPATVAALAAGAIGAVPKSSSFETLLTTVITAATGTPITTEADQHIWLGRDRTYPAPDRELAQKLGRLNPREREILRLLLQGRRAAAIAEHFTLSLTTIRAQIRAILAKLEVTSQLEAVTLLRDGTDQGR